MKYLLVIAIVVGAAYFYLGKQGGSVVVNDYPSLLAKVETQNVTSDEVKAGVNALALFFCNDAEFQRSGGSTVDACLKKYGDFKDMCESRIFENSPPQYSRKEDVIAVAKRFRTCVGIE